MFQSLHAKQLIKSPSNMASTQQFLDIEQIKDGVVIMKNGSLRAILMVSSINFELKSLEEQDAIIAYYQDFLNSLDFPIQIFVSSRKVNLKNYIESLREIAQRQTNELLRLQTEDYIGYVANLVAVTDIVNKVFYIIVPFSPVENQKGGIINKAFELFAPSKAATENKVNFEVYKDQLWQRVEHVQYGLNGAGVRMIPLNTQELIELYYSLYNPKPVEKLGIAPVEQMAINTSLYA